MSELYEIAQDHPDDVIEYFMDEGLTRCEAEEILAGILYSDDYDQDDDDQDDCGD